MSDIIREIDEDLRREDWEQVWKRHGKYVIAVALGIVVATAALVGWREYDKRQRAAEGAAFAEVIERVELTGNAAAAADILDTYLAGAPDGYALLARFRQAKLIADAGDRAAAAAAYDAVAADGGAPELFRDMATLYAVRMRIGTGEPAALVERLDPLAADGRPWRYSARELTAIVLLGAGDMAAGREAYARLADDLDAPRSLRARAAEMLRALGAQGAAGVPAQIVPTPAPEGAPATQ